MIKKLFAVLLCLSVLFSLSACGDEAGSARTAESGTGAEDHTSKLFGKDVIKIEISTTGDAWNELMENAVSKPYISGDVTIDGVTFGDVGIKTKGNTTLTQVAATDSDRYSLKINFGKYVDGQTCYGLDKLVLNNVYGDNTYLKEYMSYQLFEFMDVPSSLCTYAEIYVNGGYYGFFVALEDVDDSFLERNYGSDQTGEAYKPESLSQGGEAAEDGEGVAAKAGLYQAEGTTAAAGTEQSGEQTTETQPRNNAPLMGISAAPTKTQRYGKGDQLRIRPSIRSATSIAVTAPAFIKNRICLQYASPPGS